MNHDDSPRDDTTAEPASPPEDNAAGPAVSTADHTPMSDAMAAEVAAELADLERELSSTEPPPADAKTGADRYIAMLEDEVFQLNAVIKQKDAALEQAEARADRAHDEVEKAKARLRKEAGFEARRKTEAVLREFLEVLDDLERAIDAAKKLDHNPEVVAGIELVLRRFHKALAQFDVTPQPAEGQRFDPALHEAVSMIPVTDPALDGDVVAVTRQGYIFGDRVLRPARVVIGRVS